MKFVGAHVSVSGGVSNAPVNAHEIGAKSFKIGGAKVFENHANFIINDNNATSTDVLELMLMMYNKVKEKSEIKLNPEVVYLGNKSEIEEIISSYAKGYKFERLYSTDKCALYIAVAELKYFADVPNVVAIDEALSLVRKYSTDESLNYVNGILASLKKDLEA